MNERIENLKRIVKEEISQRVSEYAEKRKTLKEGMSRVPNEIVIDDGKTLKLVRESKSKDVAEDIITEYLDRNYRNEYDEPEIIGFKNYKTKGDQIVVEGVAWTEDKENEFISKDVVDESVNNTFKKENIMKESKAYYEYPENSGCHVRETANAFVAIDKNGNTIGQSKTKAEAEDLIDEKCSKKRMKEDKGENAMHDYEVGDRIRIKPSITLPNSYTGRVGTIKSIEGNSLETEFSSPLPQNDRKKTFILYPSEVELYAKKQMKEDKEELKTWSVPVVYEMMGRIEVEAKSAEEAYRKVKNNEEDFPLPINAYYVDDSFMPAYDDIEDIELLESVRSKKQMKEDMSSSEFKKEVEKTVKEIREISSPAFYVALMLVETNVDALSDELVKDVQECIYNADSIYDESLLQEIKDIVWKHPSKAIKTRAVDNFESKFEGATATFTSLYDYEDAEGLEERENEKCTITALSVFGDYNFDNCYWSIKFDDGEEFDNVPGIALELDEKSLKEESLKEGKEESSLSFAIALDDRSSVDNKTIKKKLDELGVDYRKFKGEYFVKDATKSQRDEIKKIGAYIVESIKEDKKELIFFGKKDKKDELEEASKKIPYGLKAFQLNEIISHMNNETAYYGSGWLYVWPDGTETVKEAQEYFGEKEEYEELEELFKKIYKRYHRDGLYKVDDKTLAAARKWDKKLGLSEIVDVGRKDSKLAKLDDDYEKKIGEVLAKNGIEEEDFEIQEESDSYDTEHPYKVLYFFENDVAKKAFDVLKGSGEFKTVGKYVEQWPEEGYSPIEILVSEHEYASADKGQ